MSDPAIKHDEIWYDANCHCRRLQLRVRCRPLYQLPDPQESTSSSSSSKDFEPFALPDCNCSICVKNGYHNIYPENPDKDIEWISGRDEMTSYQYGPGIMTHQFCPTCGSSIVLLIDMSKMGKPELGFRTGINVRNFHDCNILAALLEPFVERGTD